MDILARITEIRLAKNMSVYKLAERCGIAKNTIYNWYSKNYVPSLNTLQIICEQGFGISMCEFFAKDCNLIVSTPETQKLLEAWQLLTVPQKQMVMQLISSYHKKD